VDDVDGEQLVRVTSGIAHHDFRDVDAMGLGRLVLSTRNPQATADYFADNRFVHDRRVDAVARREGLRAVLGVPLMMREEPLGVLSVADRRRRDFARENVVLLGALASLAAAAIENARLFEQSERVIAELEKAHQTVARHAEVLETVAVVHERLTQLALDGADLQQVAVATAEWSGCEIRIEDAAGRELAASRPCDERDATQSVSETPGSGSPRSRVFPVVAGGRRLGTLLVTDPAELDALRMQTLERASQVVALLLLNEQAVLEAEQHRRNSLLRHLIDHPNDPEVSECRRAAESGVNVSSRYRVAAVRAAELSREQLLAASSWLSRRTGVLVAEHEDVLVVLMPCSGFEPESVGRDLRRMWTLPVTGAWAGPAQGASEVGATVSEATRALRLLQALGRSDEIIELRDIGLYGFLFANAEAKDLDEFVEAAIGPVLTYDRRHGTHLAHTLEVWFAEGATLASSAAALHVHVNTLYKRLERLDVLLGTGWRAADDALRIQLALRLHRLRASGNN
jgi:hypothetical protein